MFQTPRILVIDDNPDDRALVIHELRREFPDLQVTEITDETGLGPALVRDGFDLVVTDYHLRWTDGITVLRAAKERCPDCAVIMFTGTGNEEIAVEAMKAGLDDYVIKSPRHYVRLVVAARTALEKTEQRRAAQEAESRYRRIFDGVPVGLYRATPAGRILDANPAMLQCLGYPDRQSITGASVADWYVDVEAHARRQALLEREGFLRDFETQFRRRDGALIWVRESARADRDGDGTLLYYEGFLEDITDRRRAEEALRESEELFRFLVDSVQDYAIFMLDINGRIVSWNPGAERITGYHEEEIVGEHFSRLFTLEDNSHQASEVELQTAAEKGRADDERWHVRKDGTVLWASGVTTALRDETGKLRGFAKVMRDVTERKRLEEELRRRAQELAEADRRKDEFLAMLAHELRNPLGAISNSLHILDRIGSQDPRAIRQRETVTRQIQHLARLVDDLLDVSRITRGVVELRTEPVDLAAIVDRAIESVRATITARGHGLAVSLPPEPVLLEADPTRLEQILWNLLNNAAKYTESGGHIGLTAEVEGGELVLRVRDTGIGIHSEMLPRIFDLFTQVNPSIDRSQGGLGIGLTLVRRLVEMHGGSVAAYSAGPGQGSEFLVRLPIAARAPRRRQCGRARDAAGAAGDDGSPGAYG